MNGEGVIDGDDTAVDDVGPKVLKLQVESLEADKASLVIENGEARKMVETLTAEIETARSNERELKAKMEAESKEFEANRRILEEVAKRNVELENEVFRLQHDLITTMHAGEAATAEVTEVRGLLGEAEVRLEEAKKEKVEMERKLREFERTVGVLEVRETEEKSKRLRLEEETKEKIAEKEKRLNDLEEKLEAAESEIVSLKEAKSGAQMLNGIEVYDREVGIHGSRMIVGSVGGAVLVAATVAIVLLWKSRKA